MEITVLNEGKLSFCFWDVDYTNNVGSVTAFVKVVRSGKNITKLAIATGSSSDYSSGAISTGNASSGDYASLDCSTNLPKLSTKLKSEIVAGYTIERDIHGATQPYNDIQPWSYHKLTKKRG